MKNGITVAGNIVMDIVKKIDSYPKEGMLANIVDVSYGIGGCTVNTLYDLAKMDSGMPLYAMGRIGDDENGRNIVNTLKEAGIDVAGVSVSSKHATSFTDVMVNINNGNRTFFHERGANQDFSIEHIDIESITSDIFHFGYALLLDSFDVEDADFGTVMARVLAAVQQRGIKTSIDVVSENSDRYQKIVKPSLKYCDYIILNEIEAGRIADIEARDGKDQLIMDHLPKICQNLLSEGVSKMVVVHMPECGCAMTQDGAFYFEPSYNLPPGFIKGGVGAGDAFCAGMLYGIYHDWKIEDAIRYANMSAACCLSHENSVDGMKTKAEIIAMQQEFKIREF